MTEEIKFNVNALSSTIEEEIKKLIAESQSAFEGQAAVDFAAEMTEKITAAYLEGRPDLAEMIEKQVGVIAEAKGMRFSFNRKQKIASTAGFIVRVLGSAIIGV